MHQASVATRKTPLWLGAVFLISGASALAYQVAWQRSLFAIYGINIESVTVVVMAFLLGLGIGNTVGGAFSRKPSRPVLLYFGLIEIGIGAYGFFSLQLFAYIGSLTLHMSEVATALITFLLVLFPTLLMGATLPLLVAHLVRRTQNVGSSVGLLYFVNTAGSAVASVATVVLLLRHLGQSGTIMLAAACNGAVGLFVIFQYLGSTRSGAAQ